MRRILPALLILASATSLASAGDNKGRDTVKGYLVDIACLRQRSSELDALGPKHTKQCLTMPQCERSGYAVLTNDLKVVKLDAAGNEKAKKVIASSKREKNYRIAATGNVIGDEMRVSKLELLK